jgi:L-asparaginase II
MYCAALPEAGLGVAIKVDDGNNSRACEVVMATLIGALVPLHTDSERQLLASLADVTLFNWRGLQVGRLGAHASLRELVGPRHRANRAMV